MRIDKFLPFSWDQKEVKNMFGKEMDAEWLKQ